MKYGNTLENKKLAAGQSVKVTYEGDEAKSISIKK